MKSAWHVLDPEVMYWAPRQMRSIWGAESIFITENGCAASDVVADDGWVYDSDRVMFLRACLGQLQRATAEGVPVDGYFHWSAQDNFEWMDGFGNRFGLIYVDSTPWNGLRSSARTGSARSRGKTPCSDAMPADTRWGAAVADGREPCARQSRRRVRFWASRRAGAKPARGRPALERGEPVIRTENGRVSEEGAAQWVG